MTDEKKRPEIPDQNFGRVRIEQRTEEAPPTPYDGIDPLADSAQRATDLADNLRGPDATGDVEAITNLGGLERGPGISIRVDGEPLTDERFSGNPIKQPGGPWWEQIR